MNQDVILCHDIFADQTPAFANIELGGPVVAISPFISRQPPAIHLFTERFWDTGIMTKEPKKSLFVIRMLLNDSVAFRIIRIRKTIISANEVDRKGTTGIEVELASRYGAQMNSPRKGNPGMRLDVPQQQFVVRGVVVLRPRPRNFKITLLRGDESETVCLYPFIAGSDLTQWPGLHAPK